MAIEISSAGTSEGSSPMSEHEFQSLSPEDQARLARVLMRRQGSLSVRVASVFVVLVLGVPLINRFLPGLAETPILGFTATWLFLGVLIYPITVGLSFYFVAASNKIEADCTDWRKTLEGEAGR
jgi:uncharacterized membrane protein (DUF485 family)